MCRSDRLDMPNYCESITRGDDKIPRTSTSLMLIVKDSDYLMTFGIIYNGKMEYLPIDCGSTAIHS